MPQTIKILYCHCAYSRVLPEAVKDEVLRGLSASGVAFEAVADLCGLAARRDPVLRQVAESGAVKIAACYPRAVRWLFSAGGAPLPQEGVEVLNMRAAKAGDIVRALAGERSSRAQGTATGPRVERPGGWIPWFPVIDYDRCTNCKQCLSFCLFGVYGVSADGTIDVQNPEKCKTNCPACARICPEAAILFPKYQSGIISGDEVAPEALEKEKLRIDRSVLAGKDVYAALRDRSRRASSRFSADRDEQKAMEERARCLCLSTIPKIDVPLDSLRAPAGEAEAGVDGCSCRCDCDCDCDGTAVCDCDCSGEDCCG